MKKHDGGSFLVAWATWMVGILTGAASAAGTSGGGPEPPWVARWSPFELSLEGPFASEADDAPNPFLDYRLQVEFEAPSGTTYDVPGFFDGDGSGSGVGTTWKARFTPDETGLWTWKASFRAGPDVAVSLDPWAGSPASFDGASGSFMTGAPAADARGFRARGRLRYVGRHHLRSQDGTWFLKTGTNSPENLLGFTGFDGVQDMGGLSTGVLHDYAAHVADWKPGDPADGSSANPHGLKGLIGALNYLADQGVNAVYFLPMNLGGDGQDTAPFLGYAKTAYDKTHYDVSRLQQWNTVFGHAMELGIQLQFVLSETEPENETWLDDGDLGVERKLFFRELVARFGHHHAIKWNLAEENDFWATELQEMAAYLGALDPYDHPLGVHNHADGFWDYEALLGDPRFTITSIQYDNAMAGPYVEEWRQRSAEAGQPWVLDLDENGTPWDGVSDLNGTQMRKVVLYDTLFSGGNIEWYLGSKGLPLGGDQSLEDFRTRSDIWRYSRYAREFLENELPFWDMEPADHLVTGESPDYGGAEVFAADDGNLAVYLPKAQPSGTLDLTWVDPSVPLQRRWYDPRSGTFAGAAEDVTGGGSLALGSPPYLPEGDWVVLIQRRMLSVDTATVPLANPRQVLFLDAGPGHAFETYQILTTASGTFPGTPVGPALLPLNWDAFTSWSLLPAPDVAAGFAGTLDADGRAVAVLDGGPGLTPAWVGVTLHHAFLAGTWAPTLASNAVSMTVLP